MISADNENDPDVLAMIGSSAAMSLSGIPFAGPVGAVRVALVDGKLVANPTYKQVAASPLELVMAGNEDAILMVESGGKEISRGADARGPGLRPRALQGAGPHPEGPGGAGGQAALGRSRPTRAPIPRCRRG